MNQHPQASRPRAGPPISTPAEARKLAEKMMDVMSALLGVIERETELVRAGKVREAMRLEEQKSELTRRYVGRGRTLKRRKNIWRRSPRNCSPRCSAITTRSAPCCRSTSPCSRPRMRCPKASSAASTPRSSAATSPIPIPRPASARRPARATSRRSRSAARSCERQAYNFHKLSRRRQRGIQRVL